MAAITRDQGLPSFPATWTGMSALGWATGSLLYLLMLVATAFVSITVFGVPFGRADIIIARELISFLVFGATIGLSQAIVLARWNFPRWPPIVGWSVGLPLGWVLGVALQNSWGLASVSPGNFVRNMTGYVILTVLAVGLLTIGWKFSGASVGVRWFGIRILAATIAIGLISTVSYFVAREEIPSYPFDLLHLIGFPLLIGGAALIAEGLGSIILDKELFAADGTT